MSNEIEKLQQVFMYSIAVSTDMIVDLDFKDNLNIYESNIKRVFDVLEWLGDNKPELMSGTSLGLNEDDIVTIGLISMGMVKYLGDYYYHLKYNNVDMTKNESKFYNSILKIEKNFEPLYNEYSTELRKMEDSIGHSFFEITDDLCK